MYSSNNVYGIQKTPETKVNTGLDSFGMAMSSGQQGAEAGKPLGKTGQIVGTVFGTAMGAIGARRTKQYQRNAQDQDKAYNAFVDNLEGRQAENTNLVPIQAANGMNGVPTETIETESGGAFGDNSIGELTLVKNKKGKYVIFDDASGTKPHEKGGNVITEVPKDAVVLDSQKSKSRYQTDLINIAKYNAGDTKPLEKRIASLPTGNRSKELRGGDNPLPQGEMDRLKKETTFTPHDGSSQIESEVNPFESTTPDNLARQEFARQQRIESNNSDTRLFDINYKDNMVDDSAVVDNSAIKKGGEYNDAPIEEHYNPMTLAGPLNNLIRSLAKTNKTERRFYQPESMKYADRSAAQRAAIDESRNTSVAGLKGKGLSVGQMQSYLSQINSRYLLQNEGVNEREMQRADAVDSANVGGRNQAGMTNIQLANQYDMQDLQAEATKQAYSNQFSQDLTNLGQVRESQQYAKDRDERGFAMNKLTLNSLATKNKRYVYDENENKFTIANNE